MGILLLTTVQVAEAVQLGPGDYININDNQNFTFAKNFTFNYVRINSSWFQLNTTIFSGGTNNSANATFVLNDFSDDNRCNYSVTVPSNCTVWLNMSNLSANRTYYIYLNTIYNDTQNTTEGDFVNASFDYTGGTDTLLIDGGVTSRLRMTYTTPGGFLGTIVDAVLILVMVSALVAVAVYLVSKFNRENEEDV